MSKLFHNLGYTLWLAWQVLLAATDVIVDTFRPRQKQKPVLIGLPVRVTTDEGLMGFSTSITMTPGTLVAGTRELTAEQGAAVRAGTSDNSDFTPKYLFIIHAIFGADLDELYDSLYDMEEKLVPSLKSIPRPAAFLFEEYNPHEPVDEDAIVGTARELKVGLPIPGTAHHEADANTTTDGGSR